jgi:hypothetical protein
MAMSQEDIAQGYGWELSIINSNSELKSLFRKARSGEWTVEKFQAELRDTHWYRRHSESWRKMYVMQRADPAEYGKQHHQMWVQLRDVAQQMGARISSKLMGRMATFAMRNGWSEGEIRNHIGHYVGLYSGRLFGEAANTGMQLRHAALANGYRASDKQVRTWARQVAVGSSQVESIENWLRLEAAKHFPSFADQLKAGIDLQDLASPYVQSMATLWEQNPAEIDMFNPTIRRAMSRISPETGKPWAMSTAEFEDQLRSDPRWRQTQNAQDKAFALGRSFLSNLGKAF